jgi:hypothetical protein
MLFIRRNAVPTGDYEWMNEYVPMFWKNLLSLSPALKMGTAHFSEMLIQ